MQKHVGSAVVVALAAGTVSVVGVARATGPEQPAKQAAPAAAAGEKPKAEAAKAEAPAGPKPLAVGTKAPSGITLTNAAGEKVALDSLYAKKPVVLVFYRGGWCPFCNKHLAAWESKLPELKAAGAEIIAVAMEKPSELTATKEKDKLSYTLLNDADGSASKQFGLLFDVDAKTKQVYEGYKIDLAAKNSNGQWQLPHPGTFVIDTAGVVRYSQANADYKVRTPPEDVIAAVKSL